MNLWTIAVVGSLALGMPALANDEGGGDTQPPPGNGGHGGRHHPPPQAIDACKDKAAGDACSFEGRRGQMEGTCFTHKEDKPLACRPNRPPPQGQ